MIKFTAYFTLGNKNFYLAPTGDIFFFLPTLAFDKTQKDLSLAWLNWQIGVTNT